MNTEELGAPSVFQPFLIFFFGEAFLNPSSANPTKWSNKLKKFVSKSR